MGTSIYIFAYAHTRTCTYTHIHTYTHTHEQANIGAHTHSMKLNPSPTEPESALTCCWLALRFLESVIGREAKFRLSDAQVSTTHQLVVKSEKNAFSA
jgi:hypothetical protein